MKAIIGILTSFIAIGLSLYLILSTIFCIGGAQVVSTSEIIISSLAFFSLLYWFSTKDYFSDRLCGYNIDNHYDLLSHEYSIIVTILFCFYFIKLIAYVW